MARRAPLVVGTMLAVVLSLTACVFGGDSVSEHKANLANQRESALLFLEMQGGVEQIRFTREGGKPGLGASWSVNAVVTIGGQEYRAILGLDLISSEPLPNIDPQAAPAPVTVVYSDGSSEVLE